MTTSIPLRDLGYWSDELGMPIPISGYAPDCGEVVGPQGRSRFRVDINNDCWCMLSQPNIRMPIEVSMFQWEGHETIFLNTRKRSWGGCDGQRVQVNTKVDDGSGYSCDYASIDECSIAGAIFDVNDDSDF